MSVHIAEAIVDPHGRLTIVNLPLKPGEKVDVFVRSQGAVEQTVVDLRGSVLRFENSLDPVAESDWEGCR